MDNDKKNIILNFVGEHPVLSFFGLSTICTGIVNVVRAITNCIIEFRYGPREVNLGKMFQTDDSEDDEED